MPLNTVSAAVGGALSETPIEMMSARATDGIRIDAPISAAAIDQFFLLISCSPTLLKLLYLRGCLATPPCVYEYVPRPSYTEISEATRVPREGLSKESF
jgi:hypothetical protein